MISGRAVSVRGAIVCGMEVVLVPGANHGGWWYQPLAEHLEAMGHRAHAVTLDTHVAELVELVTGLPEPAVVLGHSYAGSVLSGAADLAPERFRA